MKNLFLLPALVASLGLMIVDRVTAQSFSNLYNFSSFTGTNYSLIATNRDGANPQCGLLLSGNTLYGTATYGGINGEGTIFGVTTNGTGFRTLYSFGSVTNLGGSNPQASLILSGSTLYGTTRNGSYTNAGAVFAINTNATGFRILHSFGSIPNDGGGPSGVILFGNILFGTTLYGGLYNDPGVGLGNGNGTVFAVNTNGTGYTILHNFRQDTYYNGYREGVNPRGGLVLSGNTLYGTAYQGGSFGNGTIFAINTDGTGFTNLYSFTATSGSFPYLTNSDGANPSSSLVLSGDTLYGATPFGGWSYGTIFAIKTNGTGFITLRYFGSVGVPTGLSPALTLLGKSLLCAVPFGYGGVVTGDVDVWTVNSGVYFLHPFSGTMGSSSTNQDGAQPLGGLIVSGNVVYGTARGGGSFGNGTVFSISLPPTPSLAITGSTTNVILTWPNSAPWVTLQFATNLTSPVVWNANSLVPAIVNEQNVVTNPASGKQQFFRLIQ